LGAWEDLPARRIALVAHSGDPLAAVDLTPPVALLLGAEREGLPENLVTTSRKASIPTPGDAESLNVAAAGAIALYELSRRDT
jgi:TrmH family RNA methyltransferase